MRVLAEGEAKSKRSAQLERSQLAALAAIAEITSYLDSDEDLPDFFARLSSTIAELTGATRAAFWRLGPRGTLSVQVTPHGFPPDSPVYRVRLQLGANGDGVIERLVFADELELLKGTSPALDKSWHAAGLTDVKSSIAASWTAGERRIGAVAAYDAPHGFSGHDLWVLRLVGMVAGLLWQYKESEDELGHTAVRLEEAIAARRHLLNNIASGGDEARRRFASTLHDDSLQLLTAAELQLERIRVDAPAGRRAEQLGQLDLTLRQVEDSLRRLLTNVSPEPLQLPGDLNSAISERLQAMRVRAGIEASVDARVPLDVPQTIQAIALKNIAEALTNVEKHARATRVTVVAQGIDGGLHVEIADDGAGFVVAESVRVPGHIGLVAMRERAQLAGGWCRIESEPGAGTRIEFWVPMSL
ncbi:MAG TPA: ATP-binding protein [Candidatus Dormibacteraeota bacterium]|nr:ATP-binding protein [Candidatus Dormibacteraeota bacterium]